MATEVKEQTAIVAVTRKGAELGRRLKLAFPASELFVPEKWASAATTGEHIYSSPVKEVAADAFRQYRQLVLIMAAGIAVRSLASELKDKRHDPAVVVVDDMGNFAVSLLSGHLGGANELAREVAAAIGAQPVVTTASDAGGTIAVDLLGKDFGWEIEDHTHVTPVSAAVVNGDPVGVYQEAGERDWRVGALPGNIKVFESVEALNRAKLRAALVITDRVLDKKQLALLPEHTVVYRPKTLVAGIGCNRGTTLAQIEEAVSALFLENNLAVKSIKKIATIDLKKDEIGLQEFARKYRLPVECFGKEDLSRVDFPSPPSETVEKYVGTPSVCESAAILSSGNPELIVPKKSFGRTVTVAVASVPEKVSMKKGKLFLVGLGPGAPEHITQRAREAIEESDTVVGYTTYIRLIEPFVGGKEIVSTGMGAEVERARMAINLARDGRKVAFVSSGDAGIYGMAGLIGEFLREESDKMPEIEVVPGVTALVSAAALLGSPITVDFAAISLSDYLVKWETILRRLEMAAGGDFVTILYNPRSRKRQQQLIEAKDIFLKQRSPSTPVGIVTNAYREGQEVVITTLGQMLEHEVGMDTVVVIGNSTTFVAGGWMVTPRGYETKYELGTSQ